MTKSDHAIDQAATDNDDVVFSPINCLPDDVVLEIFKKLMDLKTLCVSKRLYAIVRQVDTVSHTSPFSSIEELVECGWLKSLSRFERVKSLCIQIPSNYENYGCFFKWKVKTGFKGIYSFVLLLASSVYDNDKRLLLYEEIEKFEKFSIVVPCLEDAHLKVNMLKHITNNINMPFLEKVSITDPDNRGRVSVNGRESIDEFRNLKFMSCFRRLSLCQPPLLELPVSGYVMKGAALVLVENNDHPDAGNHDSFFLNDEIDIKHDKEEVAYHEAIMKIFKKHKGSIVSKEIA